MTAAGTSYQSACIAAVALLPAAIAPPLAVAAFPRIADLPSLDVVTVALVALLLLLPGLTALAAARFGLRRIVLAARQHADGDLSFAVWRVFGLLLLFGYGFVMAVGAPKDSGARLAFAVAGGGLVIGWFFLLLGVIRPLPMSAARYCAIALDAMVLSAFLHFGGGPAAAAYPLYLISILHSSWRLDLGAMCASAALGLAGFAAVIITTEFWRGLPVVAVGLLAVMVIVPAAAVRFLRTLAASQQTAAAATALRGRALSAVGGVLQHAHAATEPRNDAEVAAVALDELRGQLQDARDLLSVAAGTFAPDNEPFDLHALVNDAVAEFRRAAESRMRLTARIDPKVPFRLRGPRQQLARLVHNLIAIGLAEAQQRTVALAVDAVATDRRKVTLRFRIRYGAGLSSDATAINVIEQLARSIGGGIASDDDHITAVLPLALDSAAEAVPPDLGERPVLLVSDDSQFAGELAAPLNHWRAAVRWLGGCDTALDYLARGEIPARALLIVDGRTEPLPALTFLHRISTTITPTPMTLLMTEPSRVDALAELTCGVVDNVLAAPVSEPLLVNALHALPLDEPVASSETADAGIESGSTSLRPAAAVGHVTPITAHPRFATDPAESVDLATLELLRGLDGEDDFLGDLVESFRGEVRPIMAAIGRAADEGDLTAFRGALDALRRCAGNIGGARLCEAAVTLRSIGENELRERAREHVQRLAAELARFEATLAELLGAPQAHRR